jgi:hypothetical protein
LVGLAFGRITSAQEAQPAAAGGISAEQMAKANNPLADMNALNFQDSWVPAIRGLPDDYLNTLNLRPVMVAGRHIIRATIPLTTAPLGGGPYASGLGDINIFDAIKLTGSGSKTDIAVGPLLVLPSATDQALGQGKWQAGGAVVAIHPLPGGSLLGALITYQTDFAGDQARPDTSILAAQPIVTLSTGGGYYARSSATWVFDLENGRALVPFGIGVGRVFKGLGGVVNAFIEPQIHRLQQGRRPARLPALHGPPLAVVEEAEGLGGAVSARARPDTAHPEVVGDRHSGGERMRLTTQLGWRVALLPRHGLPTFRHFLSRCWQAGGASRTPLSQ